MSARLSDTLLSYRSPSKQDMGGLQTHYCAICRRPFPSKRALDMHMTDHPEPKGTKWLCESCTFTFSDSLALENHRIQTGHAAPDITCENCSGSFSPTEYNKHRKFPSPCSDPFKKKPLQQQAIERDTSKLYGPKGKTSSGLGASRYASGRNLAGGISDSRYYPGKYNESKESIVSYSKSKSKKKGKKGSELKTTITPDQSRQQAHSATNLFAPLHHAPFSSLKVPEPPSHRSLSSQPSAPSTIVCNFQDCQKPFRSEAGLKQHQTDAHGIGGQGLDLYGKDSWMLTQRVREQLKSVGLLHPKQTAPASQASRQPPSTQGRAGAAITGRLPPSTQKDVPVTHSAASTFAPVFSTSPTTHSGSITGLAEIEQAKLVCDQNRRLLVQTDIVIQHDGKLVCGGIIWTRIGVSKQPGVIDMLDRLCHLPTKLQPEYHLPVPKTFKDEYQLNYPMRDFRSSPDQHPNKRALRVIALSCVKVMLQDGLQEVVKVAAIDVLSCRILMAYLVCTDPVASVTDWRVAVTGLSGYGDIEAARQNGYKVLKGWEATRAALWEFIDKSTIILGYNLRSDLDALRMVHGRAVDVVKLVEKAAGGPLSKGQLGLDSLSRDFPGVHLTTHPNFGRDALINAFAIRELGLWMLKQGEELDKKAKQKSREYQRVNPLRT